MILPLAGGLGFAVARQSRRRVRTLRVVPECYAHTKEVTDNICRTRAGGGILPPRMVSLEVDHVGTRVICFLTQICVTKSRNRYGWATVIQEYGARANQTSCCAFNRSFSHGFA